MSTLHVIISDTYEQAQAFDHSFGHLFALNHLLMIKITYREALAMILIKIQLIASHSP